MSRTEAKRWAMTATISVALVFFTLVVIRDGSAAWAAVPATYIVTRMHVLFVTALRDGPDQDGQK